MRLSCTAKRLVPIFPNRFEPATAKNCSDLGGGTFVTDLKLASSKLIFAVLILRRDDAAAHGAVQMFAALPGVTARLGMAPRAHPPFPHPNHPGPPRPRPPRA